MGTSRLRGSLCSGDGRLRSWRHCHARWRRAVWTDLGKRVEPYGSHARCHPCLPGRALPRRRLGRTQGRWPTQATHRRRRCGGLAFRRLRAAGPAVSLQSLELRAGAHTHFVPPLCACHVRLHGARCGRLYLVRLRRTRARLPARRMRCAMACLRLVCSPRLPCCRG